MARLRPGWLVAFCALVLAVSAWLPWLTTSADGGGRVNAIGGKVGAIAVPAPGFGVGQAIVLLSALLIVAAAMAARQLSARAASAGALSISMVIAALIVWYFRLYVHAPIAIGYGMYVAAAMTVLAVVLSVLTMVVAWGQARL
ncbi:hypothetical protein [Mycobacterium sp. C31M]